MENVLASSGQTTVVALYTSNPSILASLQPFVAAFPGSFVLDVPCTRTTAALAKGASVVCAHAAENMDAEVIQKLADLGSIKLILLFYKTQPRNVDFAAAARLGIKVAHVPSICPTSIAEHAVSLALALNRRIHRAWNRTRDGDFALSASLVGVDFIGKTIGVVGMGRVGRKVARIFKAFEARVVCYDPQPAAAAAASKLGCQVLQSLEELYATADLITLHCPLVVSGAGARTQGMIDDAAVAKMKPGVILINVTRGGLLDLSAVIKGLRSGQVCL